MTHQPPATQFDTDTKAKFACARNDWLNDFSQLELAIRRCEERFNPARFPRGTPLSQRLPGLAGIKPSAACSDETLQKLQKLIRICEALLPLRATIVHSTMKLGNQDQTEVAIFQNSFDVVHDIPICAVLTKEDFARIGKTLRRLAHDISSLS